MSRMGPRSRKSRSTDDHQPRPLRKLGAVSNACRGDGSVKLTNPGLGGRIPEGGTSKKIAGHPAQGRRVLLQHRRRRRADSAPWGITFSSTAHSQSPERIKQTTGRSASAASCAASAWVCGVAAAGSAPNALSTSRSTAPRTKVRQKSQLRPYGEWSSHINPLIRSPRQIG